MSTAPARDGRPTATLDANLQFVTFLVDRLYFGVPVLQVQEVMRYQEMTRVPRAPAVVRGVINLRGQIVTAIDMRRRLDLRDRDASARPMNVLVRTSDGVVSLLVDEVGEVLEVQQEHYDVAPETVAATLRSLITGVYKLPGRLLLALDVERVTAPQAFEVET